MIPVSQMIKVAAKTVTDNSPAILTAIGVTGVVTSGILAAKGGFKAADILAEAKKDVPLDESDQVWTFSEKFHETWKCYIPAAAVGTATIVCVIGANTVNSKRAAALAGAYSITEAAFKEYKAKVVETIGENRDKTIMDEIAKERIMNDPVSKKEVIITGGGDVLCYDSLTGRYFESSIEKIRRAENDINFQILDEGYASKNDFYNKIGLKRVADGDDLGWRYENKMEIAFTTTMTDDGRPCIVLNYGAEPIKNYYKGY